MSHTLVLFEALVVDKLQWPSWALRTILVLSCLVVAAFCAENVVTANNTRKSKVKPMTFEFRVFQAKYLAVYFTIMLADWLQGTNMYTLYSSYGVDVGALFLTGFLTSALFGTFLGIYVDTWGRKLGCIVFCLLEVVINLLEHIPNMTILLIGRFLGGLSTSLLFTAFESWMVSEHRKMKFHEEWLSSTFSIASSGNGLMAIIAGLFAQIAADRRGDIGPFQLAIVLTIVTLLLILPWNENYGITHDLKDMTTSGSNGNGKKKVAIKSRYQLKKLKKQQKKQQQELQNQYDVSNSNNNKSNNNDSNKVNNGKNNGSSVKSNISSSSSTSSISSNGNLLKLEIINDNKDIITTSNSSDNNNNNAIATNSDDDGNNTVTLSSSDWKNTLIFGMKLLKESPAIFYLGLSQACFEGAIYSFAVALIKIMFVIYSSKCVISIKYIVFLWVPSLIVCNPYPNTNLPTGLIFSSFMLAMTLGGMLFSILLPTVFQSNVEYMCIFVYIVAALAMSVPIIYFDFWWLLVSFLVVESMLGIFNACGGALRSKYYPEGLQSSIMSVFRLPLNILVVIGTLLSNYASNNITSLKYVFGVIVLMHSVAAILQFQLVRSVSAIRKNK